MHGTPFPILASRTARAAALALLCSASHAGPGGNTSAAANVVNIDQARAEAGNVTSGDAAGFPVTISQPGSYRLTSNLVVPAVGINGIQVSADNVTIDFNGFTVEGPITCSGSRLQIVCNTNSTQSHGVSAPDLLNTVVRNGGVRGFGHGIVVGDAGRVEDMHVSSTPVRAINSSRSLIQRNVVQTTGQGILGTGMIRDNAIYNARNEGIVSWGEGYIVGNQVSGTGSYGILAYKTNWGHAGVAHNRVMHFYGAPISGGISLGDGLSNLCHQTKC
jgi:hypothetical protein